MKTNNASSCMHSVQSKVRRHQGGERSQRKPARRPHSSSGTAQAERLPSRSNFGVWTRHLSTPTTASTVFRESSSVASLPDPVVEYDRSTAGEAACAATFGSPLDGLRRPLLRRSTLLLARLAGCAWRVERTSPLSRPRARARSTSRQSTLDLTPVYRSAPIVSDGRESDPLMPAPTIWPTSTLMNSRARTTYSQRIVIRLGGAGTLFAVEQPERV